jgi:Raf kinase inhibitor-like YbhB/YbcL family protein
MLQGDILMKLKSKDFTNDGNIPSEFSYDGRDVSSKLMWEDIPEGTKSFTLSLKDPDFSGGVWLHWLVYDISVDVRQSERASLPDGAKEVINAFSKKSYEGLVLPRELVGTFYYFCTRNRRIRGPQQPQLFLTKLNSTLSRKLKSLDNIKDDNADTT